MICGNLLPTLSSLHVSTRVCSDPSNRSNLSHATLSFARSFSPKSPEYDTPWQKLGSHLIERRHISFPGCPCLLVPALSRFHAFRVECLGVEFLQLVSVIHCTFTSAASRLSSYSPRSCHRRRRIFLLLSANENVTLALPTVRFALPPGKQSSHRSTKHQPNNPYLYCEDSYAGKRTQKQLATAKLIC